MGKRTDGKGGVVKTTGFSFNLDITVRDWVTVFPCWKRITESIQGRSKIPIDPVIGRRRLHETKLKCVILNDRDGLDIAAHSLP